MNNEPKAINCPDELSLASARLQPPHKVRDGVPVTSDGRSDYPTHCGYPEQSVTGGHGLRADVSRACDAFFKERGMSAEVSNILEIDGEVFL